MNDGRALVIRGSGEAGCEGPATAREVPGYLALPTRFGGDPLPVLANAFAAGTEQVGVALRDQDDRGEHEAQRRGRDPIRPVVANPGHDPVDDPKSGAIEQVPGRRKRELVVVRRRAVGLVS